MRRTRDITPRSRGGTLERRCALGLTGRGLRGPLGERRRGRLRLPRRDGRARRAHTHGADGRRAGNLGIARSADVSRVAGGSCPGECARNGSRAVGDSHPLVLRAGAHPAHALLRPYEYRLSGRIAQPIRRYPHRSGCKGCAKFMPHLGGCAPSAVSDRPGTARADSGEHESPRASCVEGGRLLALGPWQVPHRRGEHAALNTG